MHYADLTFTTGSSPFAHPGHTGKGCQGKRRIQANAHIGSAGRCLTAEREAKVGYIAVVVVNRAEVVALRQRS